MWEEKLSENAQRLLSRLIILGRETPGREIQDRDLFGEEAGLDYDAYDVASWELVQKGYAENPSGGSDRPSLKATPKGEELFREL